MARGCAIDEVEIFAVTFSYTYYKAVSAVVSSRASHKIFLEGHVFIFCAFRSTFARLLI